MTLDRVVREGLSEEVPKQRWVMWRSQSAVSMCREVLQAEGTASANACSKAGESLGYSRDISRLWRTVWWLVRKSIKRLVRRLVKRLVRRPIRRPVRRLIAVVQVSSMWPWLGWDLCQQSRGYASGAHSGSRITNLILMGSNEGKRGC